MLVRGAVSKVKGGSRPRLPQIETDWSWGMIQSACIATNNMNVTHYLRAIYRDEVDLKEYHTIHIVLCMFVDNDLTTIISNLCLIFRMKDHNIDP